MGVRLRIIGLLFCAIPAFSASAQEQRVVNGRRYTVHVVEAGQTLYAIARSSAVPVDVLLAANPSAQDGLSIGEEVLIPADAVVKKELRSAPVLRNGELVHVVRKKETLFGISRQYSVDINLLLERNPGALDLKEGVELVIPVAHVGGAPATTLVPAVPGTGTTHTVQPGETLFGLGQRYAVDPEAIRNANGGLPEGLKAGGTIIIPGVAQDEVPAKPVARAREHVRYKVGLLLPFSVARNDSTLARAGASSDEVAYYEPTRAAVQFHNGARMAIDSLRRMGLDADVDVVDTGDDAKVWNAVIKRPGIQEYDLFIGPFHRSAIEQLARANQRAHIVCPVQQSNKVILGMPTVSKVTPARSDLVKHASRFVATRYANANIILLRPDITSEKELVDQVRGTLNGGLIQRPERLRDSVVVAKPGKRDLGDLSGKLDAGRLNVIMAPSEDVEFVTMLVSKLKPLASKYKIRLVGLGAWYDMPSVTLSDLDVLDFTFPAPTFFNPDDPRMRDFIAAYREAYKTDVDEFALLGFDVTLHYLKALMADGAGFVDRLSEVRSEPLHMGFRMTRTGDENGLRNEFGIMLEQDDMKLVRIP